jgi:hypothetical protein
VEFMEDAFLESCAPLRPRTMVRENISLETWPDGQMFRPHRTASYDTYGERWPGSITDQKPGIRVIHPVGEDMAR